MSEVSRDQLSSLRHRSRNSSMSFSVVYVHACSNCSLNTYAQQTAIHAQQLHKLATRETPVLGQEQSLLAADRVTVSAATAENACRERPRLPGSGSARCESGRTRSPPVARGSGPCLLYTS